MDSESAPRCPLCQSSSVVRFSSGTRDAHRGIERPFTFFLCQECRLRFQIPKGDPAKLFEDQEQATKGLVPFRRELRCDRDVLDSVGALTSGRRLLEIGPGDGRFLRAATEAGWHAVGVEVSERLANYSRQQSGAEVRVGHLADLALPDGSFDFVNLDHVLMYVETPAALLIEVRRVLASGGICRIREYDPDSLSARASGPGYWMYSPMHLVVWPSRSISRLAALSGMRVLRTFPGTEASFRSWVDAERMHGPLVIARCAVQFILRRIDAFGLTLAADKSYYLRSSAS